MQSIYSIFTPLINQVCCLHREHGCTSPNRIPLRPIGHYEANEYDSIHNVLLFDCIIVNPASYAMRACDAPIVLMIDHVPPGVPVV